MERKKQIILITIGVILYFFANVQRVAVPGAIFDLLQGDLNISASHVTALGASFMYVYAICQLIIGIMTDKYGGVRIITFGSLFFFLGSIIFPLSDNLFVLYLSRTLVGLGSSTIYLSLIKEIKQTFSSRNFGIMLSLALLIGYLGGIFANAPFVVLANKYGWRDTLFVIGILTGIFGFIFMLISFVTKKKDINKNIKLNLKPFIKVLTKRKNINLYLFAGLNYGMYYVLQTAIGMKFLEDFCMISVEKAAIVLSVMAGLYAVSGSMFAFLSKLFYTRKVIFLRSVSIITFSIFTIISVLLFFDIKATMLISALMLILAGSAGLSPLLVPLLHDTNDKEVSGTAVSVMTSGFYICVGFLGNITGALMNIFPALTLENGIQRYSNNSYILIFVMFVALALISMINVFKLKESKKTERLLSIKHLAEVHEG